MMNDRQGSKWHRWDPHIHPPGTVLADRYPAATGWEEFLTRIESSDPPIRALGITDYYSVDAYETVLSKRSENRLEGVGLIFPNIEMRYGIGTFKGSPIHVHLLVSPEDPSHVDEIRRFLRALTFEAFDETFRCDRADLIRLGRAHDRTAHTDGAALAVGTNQFKVHPDQLSMEWRRSAWVRENVLIAVAAGSEDGTSGLQKDASLAALRKEIEKKAHIIFSPNQKQRDFWLGRGAATIEELHSDWGGPKPCLHGSDAHGPETVGAPDLERLCWIKGDLDFESLRQVCLEPEDRVTIGSTPPRGALPSQTISSVSVTNAPWLMTQPVSFNSGFVSIIGARGSGKTALADILASGGFASPPRENDRSFVRRAASHLLESAAAVEWESGDRTRNNLVEPVQSEQPILVQYLSQQFVDDLCSAEGVTDQLLAEIERVIFQAYPDGEKLGATTFRELLNLRVERARAVRESHEERLADIASELNVERDRRASLPSLRERRRLQVLSVERDKRDRSTLINRGGEERAARLDEVTRAAETVRSKIEQAQRRLRSLERLKDEVSDMRTRELPQRLRRLQQEHAEGGLSPERWQAFALGFTGDVDLVLQTAITEIETERDALAGPAEGGAKLPETAPPPSTSFLPDDQQLAVQTLSLLDREVARLRALVGIDAAKAKAFAQLSDKISRQEAALAKLDREIETANEADARIAELIQERHDSYATVFEAIIKEEEELNALYEPLKEQLAAEEGSLGKLSFAVRRIVDLAAWAEGGEDLLDLRKGGPFKGRGSLFEAAEKQLLPAWESGSSAQVAEAMAEFRSSYEAGLIEHAPVERKDADAFRDWGGKISSWLYGTGHIAVNYSVEYEGRDVKQLSQGTRGIVLLLLYLAVDREDDRPLVIDQPEESLDPKSIFDELVKRFRWAKHRRQIIIVTHNANLVVNGDADQIIVAECGPHRPNQLPEISYTSGGLENREIRRKVCEILEGGEAAFRERARRLRVAI